MYLAKRVLLYLQEQCIPTLVWFLILHFVRSSKNVTIRFARRTDVMPPAPEETKFHPSAVDLLLIKRLISETTKVKFDQFLEQEFVGISKPLAKRLIGMYMTWFVTV